MSEEFNKKQMLDNISSLIRARYIAVVTGRSV